MLLFIVFLNSSYFKKNKIKFLLFNLIWISISIFPSDWYKIISFEHFSHRLQFFSVKHFYLFFFFCPAAYTSSFFASAVVAFNSIFLTLPILHFIRLLMPIQNISYLKINFSKTVVRELLMILEFYFWGVFSFQKQYI